MSTPRAARPWSDVAIRHLLDSWSCPVCGGAALFDRRCRNCGAELSGELTSELWAASAAAAVALKARQEVLDRVPRFSTATEADAAPPTATRAPTR